MKVLFYSLLLGIIMLLAACSKTGNNPVSPPNPANANSFMISSIDIAGIEGYFTDSMGVRHSANYYNDSTFTLIINGTYHNSTADSIAITGIISYGDGTSAPFHLYTKLPPFGKSLPHLGLSDSTWIGGTIFNQPHTYTAPGGYLVTLVMTAGFTGDPITNTYSKELWFCQ